MWYKFNNLIVKNEFKVSQKLVAQKVNKKSKQIYKHIPTYLVFMAISSSN